ncbi:MAG: DUF1203 domain-containing protein [Alphaproteobacteria bacterium]|nr:DUF1203 domain-containing protein [Alphaproteobacteria bacterium]
MKHKFLPMPTEQYLEFINGGLDAHGNKPTLAISDGGGMPCRHCLDDIAKGDEFLALAYSPFTTKHAYTEVGPIFLHAKTCKAYDADTLPPSFLTREHYMIRGYSKATKAIMYGTGQRVASADIGAKVEKIFANEDCEYVHVRSATYTCFACRIERN